MQPLGNLSGLRLEWSIGSNEEELIYITHSFRKHLLCLCGKCRVGAGGPGTKGERDVSPYPPLLLHPGFPLAPNLCPCWPFSLTHSPPALPIHLTRPGVSAPMGRGAQASLTRHELTAVHTSLHSSCPGCDDRFVWLLDSLMSIWIVSSSKAGTTSVMHITVP